MRVVAPVAEALVHEPGVRRLETPDGLYGEMPLPIFQREFIVAQEASADRRQGVNGQPRRTRLTAVFDRRLERVHVVTVQRAQDEWLDASGHQRPNPPGRGAKGPGPARQTIDVSRTVETDGDTTYAERLQALTRPSAEQRAVCVDLDRDVGLSQRRHNVKGVSSNERLPPGDDDLKYTVLQQLVHQAVHFSIIQFVVSGAPGIR